jgi:hypothetical protein
MSKELEVMKPSGAVTVAEDFNAGQMMHAMIKAGVTAENVAAFKELVLLQERGEDRNAKRQFAAAFSALQAEMPAVQAMQAVPNKDGSLRYKFAPYEAVLKQVKPYLDKHGFSLRFSQKLDTGKITMVCTLLHVGGHSEQNEFTCRIGQGPPGASDAQADGAASSYAQRGALCDALNIVVRKDTDANIEGGTITAEDAAELRARVKKVGADEAAFLRLAGALSFETISDAKYEVADEWLRGKEKADPKRELLAKLWDACQTFRGTANNWKTAESQLREWKILKPDQNVASLKTPEDFQEVIDKIEIQLGQ